MSLWLGHLGLHTLLVLSRAQGNTIYRDYAGILFLYSLRRTSMMHVWGLVGFRVSGFRLDSIQVPGVVGLRFVLSEISGL